MRAHLLRPTLSCLPYMVQKSYNSVPVRREPLRRKKKKPGAMMTQNDAVPLGDHAPGIACYVHVLFHKAAGGNMYVGCAASRGTIAMACVCWYLNAPSKKTTLTVCRHSQPTESTKTQQTNTACWRGAPRTAALQCALTRFALAPCLPAKTATMYLRFDCTSVRERIASQIVALKPRNAQCMHAPLRTCLNGRKEAEAEAGPVESPGVSVRVRTRGGKRQGITSFDH